MENLNAEQIKKALECCVTVEFGGDCPFECPYAYNDDCENLIFNNALALITSQEQRIKELAEENERLKKDNEYILMQHAFQRRPSGDCWNDVIEQAKADTVRKMHERLHQQFDEYNENGYSNYYIGKFIDQITKEMLDNTECENKGEEICKNIHQKK